MQQPSTSNSDKNGRWVHGLDHKTTTGKGGGKGVEEQVPWQLTTALSQGKSWRVRACTLSPGTVLRDCVCLTEHTLSPSVRLTRTATENRDYTKNKTGR